MENRIYRADLCPGQIAEDFSGHLITVYFNLPDNPNWKPEEGIVFANVSNTIDFTKVLCTNVLSSDVCERQCSFIYTKELGSSVYVSVTTGVTGNVQYSLAVELSPSTS